MHLMRNVSTWKRLLHRTVSNNANLVTVSFFSKKVAKIAVLTVKDYMMKALEGCMKSGLRCLMTGQKQSTMGKLEHYIKGLY